MRQVKLVLMALAAGAVCGALVMNWRAQLETQRKLDALAAAVAAHPAEPVVPPPAAPPGAVPRELDHAKRPPYVIEPPDVLTIEAAVRDPKTGRTDRLPVQPVSGQFLVRPDGTVGLGVWGAVEVSGLTLEQAVKAVKEKIAQFQTGEVPADRLGRVDCSWVNYDVRVTSTSP